MSARSRTWIGAAVAIAGVVILFATASIGEVMLGWQLFPRAAGPGAFWSLVTLALATVGIVTISAGTYLIFRKRGTGEA